MPPDSFDYSITSSKTSLGKCSLLDFLDVAEVKCAHSPSVLLLSGGQHRDATHSLAFSKPLLILTARNNAIECTSSLNSACWQERPFSALHRFTSFVPSEISGATAGYLSYELKNSVERLHQSAIDDLKLPQLWWILPSEILEYNHRTEELSRISITCPDLHPIEQEFQLASVAEKTAISRTSTLSREAYIRAVETIRQSIKRGEVYQANLTQRISAGLRIDPFILFKRFFRKNPAPFYAWINAGNHQIICSSMERFLMRSGSRLQSRPIKGTRPRSDEPAMDAKYQTELLNSEKEVAELSMIVDLVRNDMARVCRAGTIEVTHHKELESYENVHHLVSTINGELYKNTNLGDILTATFPAGSISGCPKISALDCIDALEPVVRHAYTGSIGHIDFNGNFDLNVAIRTAVAHNGTAHFGAGCGITWDSDPASEWQESLVKAKTFFESIKEKNDS